MQCHAVSTYCSICFVTALDWLSTTTTPFDSQQLDNFACIASLLGLALPSSNQEVLLDGTPRMRCWYTPFTAAHFPKDCSWMVILLGIAELLVVLVGRDQRGAETSIVCVITSAIQFVPRAAALNPLQAPVSFTCVVIWLLWFAPYLLGQTPRLNIRYSNWLKTSHSLCLISVQTNCVILSPLFHSEVFTF